MKTTPNQNEKPLKPISLHLNCIPTKFKDNKFQQMLLLKSLAITDDPKKLKQMIGVRTVSEVYRTLDKLALRKEFHESLAALGISFDYIVGGYKKLIDNGSEKSQLGALNALLKSVGMHEYKETVATSDTSWETLLLQSLEGKDRQPALIEGTRDPINKEDDVLDEYEVEMPEEPKNVSLNSSYDVESLKDLYESQRNGDDGGA